MTLPPRLQGSLEHTCLWKSRDLNWCTWVLSWCLQVNKMLKWVQFTMYIYIYMYIHICIYICIYRYIYICIYIYVYIRIYTYIYIYIYVYISVCINVYIDIWLQWLFYSQLTVFIPVRFGWWKQDFPSSWILIIPETAEVQIWFCLAEGDWGKSGTC